MVLGEADLSLPSNIQITTPRLPSRALNAASGIIRRPRLDRLFKSQIDLFWAPAPAPLALSSEIPLVLTVHDLSFESSPRHFTAYERFWHRVANPRRLAKRASQVIAVSNTTARELCSAWKLAAEGVAVVHNGVSKVGESAGASTDSALNPLGIRRPYFLFIGALEPRKAPDLLAQAFRQARREGLNADLVFVGEGRLARELTGENTHLLGRADEQIGELLRSATAVVCPSLDEGFGMVPLEAALLGTPAIVSDIPAFEETLGEACLRFRAGNSEALAGLLTSALASPEKIGAVAASARARAEQLTWDRAAAQTAEVFRTVAAQ